LHAPKNKEQEIPPAKEGPREKESKEGMFRRYAFSRKHRLPQIFQWRGEAQEVVVIQKY